MRPHPRIRKTVKWGGAVVSVLLVVVWIGSGWYYVQSGTIAGWYAQVHWGELLISYRSGVQLEHRFAAFGRPTYSGIGLHNIVGDGPLPFALSWRLLPPRSHLPPFKPGVWDDWHIPLLSPIVLAAGITVAAWRLDTLARRRANKHLCPKCAYSRTGLAAGAVCPECGAAAPVA